MVPVYKMIRVYEYLYRRKYAAPGFTLPRTERNLKMLSKFQKMIPVDSGDSFIWNFSVYAFWCHEGKLARRKIELNWIYTEAMYERYRGRTAEQTYELQQYKESKSIRNPLKEKYVLSLSPEYKEYQRRLFYNTPRGYLNCLEFAGVLYDEGCAHCRNCRYRKHCADGKRNG